MADPQTISAPDSVSPVARPVPELLAPAGDWDCARAAVENGADAIYFGLDKFNARMRARNFTEADLPQLMDFLHHRGVKGYVTLNTLVFENELADVETYLRSMIAAGVDAVIVQDVGLCRLIRQLSPDFPIHASTQMTISSAGGVKFAGELGCNLVVLARECSIKDIEQIRRGVEIEGGSTPNHSVADSSRLPLEVFVHGALCVAYSGQCLTSEALGGRSANRGECAQACRMPYELISDGKTVALGDRKYLLSPQDLAGMEVLPQLVAAGVASLKIEGRLKSPEYVASITRVYREALDQLSTAGAKVEESGSVSRSYEMEMAFSRGLYTGWFAGINNQQLVHARFGKKRGVYLGEVNRVRRDGVFVQLEGPLKPGDGVVFDAGKPEEDEEGGRLYEIREVNSQPGRAREVELRFGAGDINFERVHVGDKIWKTDDPELNRRLRRTFSDKTHPWQRAVRIEVHGNVGTPLTLIARDEFGNVARVDSAISLAAAVRQPLTNERLSDQLGRLGGTPFRLDKVDNHLEGDVLLPVSELNRLRREFVGELERLRRKPRHWTLEPEVGGQRSAGRGQRSEVGGRRSEIRVDRRPLTSDRRPPPADLMPPSEAELIVLVRSMAQLETTLQCGVRTVYCDFENPKKYRDAVTLFHTARGCSDSQSSSIWVAPPRIFKPGEQWMIDQVRSCRADGYLIRNYDHLTFFAGERCVGDFSLNVANHLSAEYFKNEFNLERVTASYDLNAEQLQALLRAAPPEWFEITIHQHMPMFHMEHCVFCAFLSKGTDYTNCGRPCDHHDVSLRDRVGAEHPLKADVGCRNTVFNARAQTGAEYVGQMIGAGARYLRIEFVNETTEQVKQTISKYRQLLRNEISGAQLWHELKLLNQLGVTRGQIAGRA